MHLKKQIVVVALALAATTSLVCGQGQQSVGTKSLVGTWQVLRHAVDCDSGQQLGPDFHVLMTFNRGGTLNAFGVPPDGSTPANTSPEYGNWRHESGHGNFSFRDVSYGYDSNGAFTGSGVLTAAIQLAADGNTFTQQTTIDVYDPDGNLIFSFCGGATGTRFQ